MRNFSCTVPETSSFVSYWLNVNGGEYFEESNWEQDYENVLFALARVLELDVERVRMAVRKAYLDGTEGVDFLTPAESRTCFELASFYIHAQRVADTIEKYGDSEERGMDCPDISQDVRAARYASAYSAVRHSRTWIGLNLNTGHSVTWTLLVR